MFDVSLLDTATPAEQGRAMEIIGPGGAVVRDGNGKAVTVTLRGRNSRSAVEAERRIHDRRADLSRRGRTQVSAQDIDDENTDLLVACTAAWDFTEMDGEPFPATSENARKFWSDIRFRTLRGQALAFMADDANFTQR